MATGSNDKTVKLMRFNTDTSNLEGKSLSDVVLSPSGAFNIGSFVGRLLCRRHVHRTHAKTVPLPKVTYR
jgi:hypothetical protein